MIGIVNKLFSVLGKNSLNKYSGFVDQVNQYENDIIELTDIKLKEKTELLLIFLDVP